MDTETTENGRCAFFLVDKNKTYNPATQVNTDMSKKKKRQTMMISSSSFKMDREVKIGDL